MSVKDLLTINPQDKALLWEMFYFEKMLDDNEAMLLGDLNYYEERIRSIGKAETSLEIGLLTIYMKHVKNIRTLLINLQSNRNEQLKQQMQETKINHTGRV